MLDVGQEQEIITTTSWGVEVKAQLARASRVDTVGSEYERRGGGRGRGRGIVVLHDRRGDLDLRRPWSLESFLRAKLD